MKPSPKPNLTLSGVNEIISFPPEEENETSENEERTIPEIKPKNNQKRGKLPNPYFIFCKERRTILHAQNPHAGSRDITKMLASEWKSMTSEQKQKYNDQYLTNLAIYKEKTYGIPQNLQFMNGSETLKASLVIQNATPDGKSISFDLPLVVNITNS